MNPFVIFLDPPRAVSGYFLMLARLERLSRNIVSGGGNKRRAKSKWRQSANWRRSAGKLLWRTLAKLAIPDLSSRRSFPFKWIRQSKGRKDRGRKRQGQEMPRNAILKSENATTENVFNSTRRHRKSFEVRRGALKKTVFSRLALRLCLNFSAN